MLASHINSIIDRSKVETSPPMMITLDRGESRVPWLTISGQPMISNPSCRTRVYYAKSEKGVFWLLPSYLWLLLQDELVTKMIYSDLSVGVQKVDVLTIIEEKYKSDHIALNLSLEKSE